MSTTLSERYAIVWSGPDGIHTLIYREADFPESELPQNQTIRTYERGCWDGRFEPNAVFDTYDAAWDAMVQHITEPFWTVAVPASVAEEHWFSGMRFADGD